ncbi:sugar ABC transporter substrate-binding protein [Mycolicibacterium sp. HK-90]|uniref:ABC transporter substrate-binding protein n=1 Tax=Mycolicibacterium sp. HK-90 TaxID=3056937 RepID=UPI002659777B|nr:sugar ABC transporter substrate-binding protein [Mycolicibacterium sp. HK-90]WKG02477.1 sugar ABC transporter substrate-binding protein [Mycolicibacterium sp. HK-90]
MRTIKRLATCLAAGALVMTAGCAGAGTLGATDQTVTIAMVSNSQMTDARDLADRFEAANPDIKLRFVTLSENQARAKITASTAMGGGEFDVVMISNYEAPQWAENGWLVNLSEHARNTPGYDEDDFIPSLRESLSYQGSMYAVPFYGESSFLMYRKDLFEQAGIAMPRNPTWQQVADAAAKLDKPGEMVGICLRGKPGWGEVLAPLDTVINTFGGRWYDEQWNAQLTSPEVQKAVNFYVDLVRSHGEPGAATSGFGECATQFAQGRAAMWYDATSAVSVLEDPASSNVVGEVGYAMAPMVEKPNSGWLYTWALGIPKSSDKPDAAWRFISWMTDKNYIRLVGEELGWARVPPGSRLSTYEIPEYQEASQAFGKVTLDSIEGATPARPTVQPVPYTGVQFLAIPEFQDLGTRVSQQISAAIAGQKSVADALEQSQQYAEVVGRTYQEKP